MDEIEKAKKLIDLQTSFSVISFPGVGISLFLKQLVSQYSKNYFYIDVFGLPNLTNIELFGALLKRIGGKVVSKNENEIITSCKNRLEVLLETEEKIVICIGGFDQLKAQFNQEFFQKLRALRNINREKIIFIFGICKRIETLVSEKIMDTDLEMFSQALYLKPYSKKDLIYLLSIYGPKVDINEDEFEKIINLSGGQFQLLQLLLRLERLNDPLHDPFIKLSLQNIYQHLNYQQKKILQKVALEGLYNNHDEYLIRVGLVQKVGSKYQLFSSLFTEFVKTQHHQKLPTKEAKLFKLLKENLGEVVSRDLIFKKIWEDEFDNTTDWALDSLIYRLRRHTFFVTKGFIIESYKKQGYMLIKNIKL